MSHAVVQCYCAEILRPLGEKWGEELPDDKFGFDIRLDRWLEEMQRLVNSQGSMVLLLYEDEQVIGCMGLEIFLSPLSGKYMANERFWYVLPEHRGVSSLRLLRAAEGIARKVGCAHLVLNASKMASDLYDKMCKLYEKLEYTHWESSYIKELKGGE